MSIQQDYSCLDTALYLSNCKAHYPISDAYEEEYPQKGKLWWKDKKENIVGGQRIHVITYLGSCYKLKKANKDSMKHVWSGNGFSNAAGLIWILEALNAPEDLIKKAYIEGGKIARNTHLQKPQCKKIKEIVSWEELKVLLATKNIERPLR